MTVIKIEPDYSKGCARYNELTCDCDLMANECKGKDFKERQLVERIYKYEQCLRDAKAWMERNYRVPSNYPVYKHIVSLLEKP